MWSDVTALLLSWTESIVIELSLFLFLQREHVSCSLKSKFCGNRIHLRLNLLFSRCFRLKMSLNTEDCSDAMNSSRRDYEPLLNTTTEPSTYLLSNDLRNQHRKNTPWLSLSSIATLLYAFVVVIGQVTQYVTLPMWIDSTKNVTSSQNQTVEWTPTIDSFFVLSFASSVFVTVFGSALVINIFVFKQYSIHKTDWNHRRVFLIVGFFQGLAAVFIVFSSSGERTPPYLQAILGNFSVPITLLLR